MNAEALECGGDEDLRAKIAMRRAEIVLCDKEVETVSEYLGEMRRKCRGDWSGMEDIKEVLEERWSVAALRTTELNGQIRIIRTQLAARTAEERALRRKRMSEKL